MMKWIASILKAGEGELSSKRFCGVLGWIVVLACYLYCCITGKAIPEMGELLMACVALLGVDSVTSVFKGKNASKETADDDDDAGVNAG